MSGIEFFLLIIAVALSIIAIFFCIALFYVILILRRLHGMMDTFEHFTVQCSDGWSGVLSRISSIKDSIQLMGQGIQTAQHLYQQYADQFTRKKKKGDNKVDASDD